MMTELVFLLEEYSAEAMLEKLLPRLLPDNFTFRLIAFEGKQHLEKNMVRRMRGYLKPEAFFIILRDKDSGDCEIIKQKLVYRCEQSSKSDFMVRIACHELESWYLADLEAVEKGLEIPSLARHQNKRKLRTPDDFAFPSKTLETLTKGKYQKVSGSRSIGPFLYLDNNRSPSFKVFINGIRRIINSN